jgi:hypothetical protein
MHKRLRQMRGRSTQENHSQRAIQGRRRSPGPLDFEMAEEDIDNEEGSTLIPDLPWSSAPTKESVPSSPGDHVGSAGPSDAHDSDGIPEDPFLVKLSQ